MNRKQLAVLLSLYVVPFSACTTTFQLRSFKADAKEDNKSLLNSQIEAIALWPVTQDGTISSNFGKRGKRHHKGIDLLAPQGSDIQSVNRGTIEFVGSMRGYGKTVIVNHGTFKTLYAHCSSLLVKKDQPVSRGQVIARVGRTGRVRGRSAHLHFEYRGPDNKIKNPLLLLSLSQQPVKHILTRKDGRTSPLG